MDEMIYWRIRQPDKKWRTWSSGLGAHVDEAQVEAMHSVCDENNQLLDWAKEGVIVEMAELRQLDDWQITPDNHQSYRKNYLGLRDPEPEPEPDDDAVKKMAEESRDAMNKPKLMQQKCTCCPIHHNKQEDITYPFRNLK